MEEIKKRFPADTSLEAERFLNNGKLDGELYAYLQSYSVPVQGGGGIQTRVYFKDLPTQSHICNELGIKSPKTLKAHLQALEEAGYLITVKDKKYYLLENKEEMFLMIPLSTLRFLLDVVQDYIIKIYLYLGQRYKYALSEGRLYTFTLQELGDHIGLKINGNSRAYEKVNNALNALRDFGLIGYVDYYEGCSPRKRLTGFSFEYIDDANKREQWKNKD